MKSTISSKRIKIILAEECQLFQDGFRLLIESANSTDFDLLKVVPDGKDLINIIKICKPDILIIANNLKEFDSTKFFKLLKSKFSSTSILLLTDESEEGKVYHLLDEGIRGFISKNASKNDLLHAINNLASGKTYYCPIVSDKIFDLISTNKLNKEKNQLSFTSQEMKVIELICQQLTTKEIANTMNICSRTVEEYRFRIQEKVGAKNVVGVVMYVMKNKLIK